MAFDHNGVPEQYNSPAFKEERDRWYRRLEEEGFEDIETVLRVTGHPGPLLRGHSPSPGDLARGLYQPHKEDYYRWAGQHVYDMPPGPDRHIWRLHASGQSVDDIHRIVGERYGVSKNYCGAVVRRERDAMKAKGDAEMDSLGEDPSLAAAMAEDTMPDWLNWVPRGAVKDGRSKRRDRR